VTGVTAVSAWLLPGQGVLGHSVRMPRSDDVPHPASDLSAYRRARQERASDALICLFSQVLGTPLERRELTPAEQARRDARRDSRRLAFG
jgi:hypothetical protein